MKHINIFSKFTHGVLNLWNKYIVNKKANWEKLYADNYALKMNSLDQRGRHLLIKGILSDTKREHSSILDIGCGVGSTFDVIKELPIDYEGIDLSGNAISQCNRKYRNIETDHKFSVQDLTTFYPAKRYDVIIINEVLYYLKIADIRALFGRLVRLLRSPDSLIIVSMSDSAKSKRIWRKINSLFLTPSHSYQLAGIYPTSRWSIRSYSEKSYSEAA